jgi:hypothetical protein
MSGKGKVFWNYWPWEYVTLSQKMVLQISTTRFFQLLPDESKGWWILRDFGVPTTGNVYPKADPRYEYQTHHDLIKDQWKIRYRMKAQSKS